MAVNEVIQTATKVLTGQLEAHEAVTILATMTRDAAVEAKRIRREDPSRADDYRELLSTVGRELRDRQEADSDKHLEAVTVDLAALHRALDA